MAEFPLPKLKKSYQAYLEQKKRVAYIKALCSDGIRWWFNMDTPAIGAHLMALAPKGPPPIPQALLPSRLVFLVNTVQPNLSTKQFERLYRIFERRKDREGTAAATGAGIASIWDSGRKYSRYRLWYERTDRLLRENNGISPLAAASLHGFRGLVELTGAGDTIKAAKSYRAMSEHAEEAGSPSLRLFFTAAVSYSLLWQGRLSEAEMIVNDAAPLALLPETSLVCKIYYKTTLGLVRTICGRPEEGRKILKEIIDLPFFDQLPPPVFYLGYGHLLHALSGEGSEEEIDGIAAKIRERAVPEQNYFHHSYLHFNLGIAYLGAGAPHKALNHGREATRKGKLSESPIAERMPALLTGQALADLGRVDEAAAHLRQWSGEWEKGGYHLLTAAGNLELARILAARGEMEEARKSFDRGGSCIPPGEPLPHLFRSRTFLTNLQERLFPCSDSTTHPSPRKTPVRIETFGDLTVRIGDRTFYDRQWRGRGTKRLLKALIVHGGTKVGVDFLADLLWPDCDGHRAFNNLKMTLSRLRKTGCRDGDRPLSWVVMKQKQVSLARTLCTVDALLFEETLCRAEAESNPTDLLREALDLYRNDFLTNDRSELWIIRHRERLRGRYLQTVFRFAKGCMEQSDTGSALPYLEDAVNRDPLNEETYLYLMQANLQMGYPSKAIQVFHQAEEVLKKTFDISPGPALITLARKAGLKI